MTEPGDRVGERMPVIDLTNPAEVEAGNRSRFWKFVQTTDGCWAWTGSHMKSGYGQYAWQLGPKAWEPRLAHRVSWALHNGPVPIGRWVLHDCDNKLCVNPAHLHLGNHRDNMVEASARGRMNPNGKKTQTHCKRGHPLSGDNLRITTRGHRNCRICLAMLDRAQKAKDRNERTA